MRMSRAKVDQVEGTVSAKILRQMKVDMFEGHGGRQGSWSGESEGRVGGRPGLWVGTGHAGLASQDVISLCGGKELRVWSQKIM